MELRQLRCFVAVAEELHFGRAAERLAVVQPAVSQQVARLERELGVRLLVRSSRRVALTGDGARLLGEARAVLAAVDRVRAVAGELAAGRAGVLRLGTGPGMADRLHRGVAELRRSAPDLGVELVDGSTPAHCAAVRAGLLDLALVRGAADAPGLHVVELWREPLSAVLPATHPAAAGDAVPVSALAGMLLRLPERDAEPALHDAVLAACRRAGFVPDPGRTVRRAEDAVVEIGAGDREVTIVYGTPPALTPAVAVRPLEPGVTVPGHLVAPTTGADACLAALRRAFG